MKEIIEWVENYKSCHFSFHTHKDGISDHTHKDGISDHTHKDGISGHAHKDGISGHAHKDGISGHAHKDGISGHAHKDGISGHAHKDGISGHAHKDGISGHAHKDGISGHAHKDGISGHVTIVVHYLIKPSVGVWFISPDSTWKRQIRERYAKTVEHLGGIVLSSTSGQALAVLGDIRWNIEGDCCKIVTIFHKAATIAIITKQFNFFTDEDLQRVYDTIPNCEYLP